MVSRTYGSESDSLAIRGVMAAAKAKERGNHIITSIIEHKAILGTAKQLHDYDGYELTVLTANEYGQVNPADVVAAIRPRTALISIMAANNEIASCQPFLEIGAIVREHEMLFHSTQEIEITSVVWKHEQCLEYRQQNG